MSLINQVLKDLDKRGANTNIGEATIRVVHGHSGYGAGWMLAAGALGMLLLLAAAWFFWQEEAKPVAPQIIAAPAPAEMVAASQVLVAPVVNLKPRIDSISPQPLLASGAAQIVIIHGANFKENTNVTLKDESGREYDNRPVVSLTPDQISLKLNLGKKAATWWVEVKNPDQTSSGQYAFIVNDTKRAALPARSAAAISAQPASSKPALPAPQTEGGVNKLPTQITVQQKADNEFRRAHQLMLQGRNTEALAGYEAALQLDGSHELARQSLVSLLVEKKRNTDAENVLQEGLRMNPQQLNFAMLLARLQVEKNALQPALETLLRSLPYADKQPNYLSFVAALMQRNNRHKEAIDYYQKALALKPGLGVWLMGLGISLRAEQRMDEARDVFKQALDTNTLSSELQSFVNQQLKEL
jgi:MSHA biogenesis protein MshN